MPLRATRIGDAREVSGCPINLTKSLTTLALPHRGGRATAKKNLASPIGPARHYGSRLGCCPAARRSRGPGAAEIRPTEPGRACPVKGVRHSAPPNCRTASAEDVVIGAGVIGLGIAWRLAQAGCEVAVLRPRRGRARRQLGGGRHARGRGRDRAGRGDAAAAGAGKPAPVAGFRARAGGGVRASRSTTAAKAPSSSRSTAMMPSSCAIPTNSRRASGSSSNG